MDQRAPSVSIIMPVYNGEQVLPATLHSILSQEYTDFELIVSDDASGDGTKETVMKLGDERITYYRNDANLGYPANIAQAMRHAKGDLVVLFAQDDLLLPGALARTVAAFSFGDRVGLVTRPYYWFEGDPAVPIRAVPAYDPSRDAIVNLRRTPDALPALFSSFGQLSGLAMRRDLVRVPFHQHVFTSHIYPVADILRTHDAVFLHQYTVAVRISSSQTRSHPEIYDPTPLATWIALADAIYGDEEFSDVHREFLRFLGRSNYVGLLQLRNYARTSTLLDECRLFLRLRPLNIVDPRFLAIALVSICLPPTVLRPGVDLYKKLVLRQLLRRLETVNLK